MEVEPMEVATLSAKSKKAMSKKKGLRKPMQSSYETIRPICTDSTEIEEIMQRLLAPAKRRSNRIPWSEFKKMSEEDKKQAKEELKMKDINKSLRNQLVYGINELISTIEKHSISSAIMCEDIVPAFMMNFIIDHSTIHHVPIIVLPKLRKLTAETLGFSCSCLGLKRNALRSENSHFYPIHKKIVEIAKEYKIPEKTNLCQCPRKEPMSPHELFTSSAKLQLFAKESDEKNVHETNSAWPCMYSNPKGYWKTKKERLWKKKSEQQVKPTGDELEGENLCALIGDELESKEVKEKSEILPGTTSKGNGSKYHYSRNPDAHPYLRTFISSLSSRKVKKQKHTQSTAECVDGDNNGGHGKKREHSLDARDGVMVSEVICEGVQSTDAEKCGRFKYLIRSGKKRVYTTFQPYNPRKKNKRENVTKHSGIIVS